MIKLTIKYQSYPKSVKTDAFLQEIFFFFLNITYKISIHIETLNLLSWGESRLLLCTWILSGDNSPFPANELIWEHRQTKIKTVWAVYIVEMFNI